jgi:hypothetical protein
LNGHQDGVFVVIVKLIAIFVIPWIKAESFKSAEVGTSVPVCGYIQRTAGIKKGSNEDKKKNEFTHISFLFLQKLTLNRKNSIIYVADILFLQPENSKDTL